MTQAAHPISIPNFRVYLIGRLSAVLSQYAMMLVLGWQAYNIARESISTSAAAAQLGFIGLAQFLHLFLLTSVTGWMRTEEHTSELQSLMPISYAVFCLKQKHTS